MKVLFVSYQSSKTWSCNPVCNQVCISLGNSGDYKLPSCHVVDEANHDVGSILSQQCICLISRVLLACLCFWMHIDWFLTTWQKMKTFSYLLHSKISFINILFIFWQWKYFLHWDVTMEEIFFLISFHSCDLWEFCS